MSNYVVFIVRLDNMTLMSYKWCKKASSLSSGTSNVLATQQPSLSSWNQHWLQTWLVGWPFQTRKQQLTQCNKCTRYACICPSVCPFVWMSVFKWYKWKPNHRSHHMYRQLRLLSREKIWTDGWMNGRPDGQSHWWTDR